MYRECRHIKDDGLRCHAAALKGKNYCFFHMKLKHMHRRSFTEIPPLEDATSVLLGIGQVMRLLDLETMELKRAGLMLYGLQIASSVVKQRKQADGAEYVRSVHNEAGEPIDVSQAYNFETRALAPESTVCEPHDCANCEQKSSCNKRAQLPENVTQHLQEQAAREELCSNGTASQSAEESSLEQLCNNSIASVALPPARSSLSAMSSRVLPEGASESSPGQAQRSPAIAPQKSSSPVGPSETLSRIAATANAEEPCEILTIQAAAEPCARYSLLPKSPRPLVSRPLVPLSPRSLVPSSLTWHKPPQARSLRCRQVPRGSNAHKPY